MKALQVRRSVPRFAAARIASSWKAGAGAKSGPLHLAEIDPPELPGPNWVRLRPRLSGICGSDLATVDGRSSRWFESIVSFPFVLGHEIVADDESGKRVVIEPVLGCEARSIEPRCEACAQDRKRHCHHLSAGHVAPGLQTGFCTDTGGGWSLGLVAHPSQIHSVPDDMSDEGAVLIEPVACAVHAALAGAPAPQTKGGEEITAVVVGSGTLGLATLAALKAFRPDVTSVIAVAKHPVQRKMAAELGADVIAEPSELRRAVRRSTGTWKREGGQLAGGVPLVFDCVGSASSLADCLAVTAPGGHIALVGMPGQTSVDLTPLWQREIALVGSYTYGPEAALSGRHSFDAAIELIESRGLQRLLTTTYPLDRFGEAIEHAAAAGRRGAIKIAFDLRGEKRR